MDIFNKIIWQQASGDTYTIYSELCLKWDVIINGPGNYGRWDNTKKYLPDRPRKNTDLYRFCEEMKEGDIVVLRLGTADVLGVGVIVGDYDWNDHFGDVDGWDIQHVRRVKWLWKCNDLPKQFPVYTMKQGDTTQRLNAPDVENWLASLDISNDHLNRPLVPLPESTSNDDIDIEEISEFLFDHGVASNSIEHLLKEIGELIRIAKWYERTSYPSEHETVAYLVVPLLRSLGWTPQMMAIEWNHVDIALFNSLPRKDDNLSAVVEAKKIHYSCLSAKSQAMNYAQRRQLCRRLIVTNGLRYGIYIRRESEFILHAYMNLTRLKREYPIYECYGARHALLAMTPEWRG